MCVNLRWLAFKRPQKHYFGLKFGWVPCGKCSECRSSMHDAWSFRLMAEADYRVSHGWKVGFFTLTYKDSQLPCTHLVNKESGELELVAHFWKPHVQELLQKVRKKLWKWHKSALKKDSLTFKDRPFVAPKWLVASEYGGRTARPHYHGLVMIPPSIDSWKVHYLIKRYWRKRGFIIPKDFEGGPENKPFVCKSWKNACWYAAKYCCKDVGHECLIANYELDPLMTSTPDMDRQFWRNMRSFHVQSRGLGRVFLDGKTDSELVTLLEKGFAFSGDDSFRPLPLYYKNKLIYSPDYIYLNDGRRLVRRKSTEFFRRNFNELFRISCGHYSRLFDEMSSADYWKKFRYKDSSCRRLASLASGVSSEDLAVYYTAYYGVPYDERYSAVPAIQWLSRHTHVKYGIFSGNAIMNRRDDLELVCTTWMDAVNSRWDFEKLNDEMELSTIKHEHEKE